MPITHLALLINEAMGSYVGTIDFCNLKYIGWNGNHLGVNWQIMRITD